MAQLLKRPAASADLEDIWWYIAQDSPEAADRLLDRIQEKLLSLSQFPHMGASRDDLMPRLRSFSVSNYLIFYFPLEDGIEVIRVLHGARDAEVIFQLG
jgi:toxin ParE1/3/4